MENLIALLNTDKYASGVDPITLSHTIDDIYRHIAGDKNSRIRLPAPSNSPDDGFDFMWPEGARVSSKAPSDTSHRSGRSHHSNRSRLSSKFVGGNISPNHTRRAMSVTSSQYSKRYVGFIDEEDEPESENYSIVSPSSHFRRRSSGAHKPQNTVRVHGGVVKPTPSLERMFAKADIGDEEEEEYAPRPPVSKKHREPANVRPLETCSNGDRLQRKSRTSKVGFGDD